MTLLFHVTQRNGGSRQTLTRVTLTSCDVFACCFYQPILCDITYDNVYLPYLLAYEIPRLRAIKYDKLCCNSPPCQIPSQMVEGRISLVHMHAASSNENLFSVICQLSVSTVHDYRKSCHAVKLEVNPSGSDLSYPLTVAWS